MNLRDLEKRFGKEKISTIQVYNELFYCVDLSKELSVKVILTSDFSNYQMSVPEKVKGFEFGELYFCLPSYWDLDNPMEESVLWIFDWLLKIKSNTIAKNTWIGDGHTFDCSKTISQFSPTIKSNHFFVSSPILLEEELQPLHDGDKIIHFWSLIPIYGDEMDYKQAKGTVKLKKKFLNKGITEKLDEFRQTSLKTRWLFF